MRSRTRRSIARGLLFALLFAPPGTPTARAEIAGEQVVSGTATFDQSGNIITITASDGAIINYSQFGVLASEEMHFVQPSSESRVLNRVFGDETHIDGGLYANGIVYIVNPAGIFFGGGAVVDVGGLYAAAGHLSNEDFLAHDDQFALSGTVANAGSIESPAVALLGAAVANHGNIHAPDGTIALVAGEKVLLTQLGAHLAVEVEGIGGGVEAAATLQAGTVDAGAGVVSFVTGDVYSLAINHTGITRGGEIELAAASGTVQVAGTLDASDRSAGGTGGDITVTGERVALLGAQLDASGDAGGGRIRVGGDLRGEGALPTARRTYVDGASTLLADAISSGDGGRVIVWADEATAFRGALSARGGAAGGDGGFAEISGARFLESDGAVDLSATSGANGTLLYDPQEISLVGGSADGSDSPDALPDRVAGDSDSAGQILFADVGTLAEPFQIYESEVERTAANVVLEATHGIVSTGTFDHIAVDEAVGVVRMADGFSLTMRTRNDAGDETGATTTAGIDLTGVSLQTTGAGTIALATGTGSGTGVRADLRVANLTTGGGNAALTTEDGAITVGNVTTAGAAGAAGGGAGGQINILAGDADRSGDSDVVAGNLNSIGGTGAAGAGGAGGAVQVRSTGTSTTPFPNGSPLSVVEGGGDLIVGNVETRGGTGTTAGGQGGSVRLETTDGSISAGALDSSGGAGGTSGGSAGQLIARTTNGNGDATPNPIALGDLRAVGGTGATGAGGAGALIDVRTLPSTRIVEQGNPENVLREATGGGSVAIASIDSSGGDGGTSGANAGVESFFSPTSIRVIASGTGSTVGVGDIAARGGAGAQGNGGSGGDIAIFSEDGDASVDAIDTTGGIGHNDANTARGGRGGAVALSAGTDEASTANLQLLGKISAVEGSGDVNTVDGGAVTLRAAGDITRGVETGPHIDTGGDVSLTAGGGIGTASAPLEIKGGGETGDDLAMSVGGAAVVRVTNAGFLGLISAVATDPGASVDLTQVGETGLTGDDVIEMAGDGSGRMVVSRAKGTVNDIDLEVGFANPDEDSRDDRTLVLAAGSVQAGDSFAARSDGDIELGTPGAVDDTVIVAGDEVVTLSADFDEDGTGALRDVAGADTGVIDLNGGDLTLFAAEGIGEDGNPITTSDGGRLAALNVPLRANPDATATQRFIADPDVDSDIYLRNQVDGDLEIVSSAQAIGVQVAGGIGDIVITNEAGGIIVRSALRAKPVDNADGTGGDVTLTVAPDSQIVFDVSRFQDALAIGSGGVQTYQGDVVLARATDVEADGGIVIQGGLDTQDSAANPVSFTAALDDGTTFAVQDGVGAQRALSSFTLSSTLVGTDDGPLGLDAPSVTTASAQTYRSDLSLAQNTTLSAGGTVEFGADVTSPSAGLTVNTPDRILFSAAGDQSVATAGVLALNPNGRTAIPLEATIAKPTGNLSLSSTSGSLIIGDREKLSVAGSLALAGNTVRFTDLSALAISVTSPDAQIFARTPGTVATAGGATLVDGGTDLLANTVAFSTPPSVVGGGAAPRIATLSGSAPNAGPIQVGMLPAPITAADIASGSRVFDLAIPTLDPGHETQELSTDPLEPPLEVYASQDRAGPGAPVSREEVAAFLACAPLADEAAPGGCEATAPPAYGSALDTERAVEVAHAYRELLGDSPRASAGRASLAHAAADPSAPLGSAASPAGRVYLTEIARVLGQVRLLGLGARYAEVRSDLLAAVAAAIGSPQLDAARLGPAVDARGMGMPI